MNTEDAREPAEPANDVDSAGQSAPELEAPQAEAAETLHPAEDPEPVPAAPVEAAAVEAGDEPVEEMTATPTPEDLPPEAAASPEMAPDPAQTMAAADEPPSFAAAPEGADGEATATGGEAEEAEGGVKDEFFEIAKTIFYALLIALVLRVLLFQPFTIPSASMEPNLYEGDYIIVSKWDYGYSRHSLPLSPPVMKGRLFSNAPKRGDIVVFKLPRDNKTDYIKRVIGLPGDRIQVIRNQLYINDKLVPAKLVGPINVQTRFGFTRPATKLMETLPNGKQHMMQDFGPDGDLDNTGVYVVPQGYYFMMGDNRDDSVDSRVQPEYGVGFVPAENLVGKARIILFSWTPGAKLYKPWTWFTHLRPSRFFHALK